MRNHALGISACLSLLLPWNATAQLDPTFSYQGRLDQNGAPLTGSVDLFIEPYNSASGGSPLATALILDGVQVNDGLFTVEVDLGPGVFLGDPIFLSIGVRDDAVGDASVTTGFTTLSPRQSVLPTPYALHADSVALDAIGGQQIADGSITATDINTTSTSVGLQRRLTAACASGSAIRDISNSGVPTCQSLVSSVTTVPESGLTVTTNAGVVTLDTNLTDTQVRVTGHCQTTPAHAINALNEDGTVGCVLVGDPPTPAAAVRLDSTGDVGEFLSVMHDQGNRVRVAYYDDTNNRLKFVACSNSECSGTTPVIVHDSANDVGQYVSLALVAGVSVMAYYDATAGNLMLATCSSNNCDGTITARTLDSTGDVGRFAEIVTYGSAFGIAYLDATNNVYKFVHCGTDPNCASPVITSLSDVAGGGLLGSDVTASRIRNSSDAFPFFVILRGGSAVVAVRCNNSACTSRDTVELNASGALPSLNMTEALVGNQLRRWVVSSRLSGGFTFPNIRVCLDRACQSHSSQLGTLGETGQSLVIVPRLQGGPVLLSTDSSVELLLFDDLRTTRLGGTIASSTTARDAAIDAVRLSDGGIGMVYYDPTAQDLVYQRCQSADCAEL